MKDKKETQNGRNENENRKGEIKNNSKMYPDPNFGLNDYEKSERKKWMEIHGALGQ